MYHAPMSHFIGGSAYAMVQQVADGFLLVTERTFRRLGRAELDQLNLEIEKTLRAVRGDQPAAGDLQAIQQRNRRIQRLNTCRMMLRTYRQQHRI